MGMVATVETTRTEETIVAKPTKEEVLKIMKQVEAMNLPDGAHWALIHEKLNLTYGDVFEYIAADPVFFGAQEVSP